MESDLDVIRFIGKKRCSKKGLMTVSPFIVDLSVQNKKIYIYIKMKRAHHQKKRSSLKPLLPLTSVGYLFFTSSTSIHDSLQVVSPGIQRAAYFGCRGFITYKYACRRNEQVIRQGLQTQFKGVLSFLIRLMKKNVQDFLLNLNCLSQMHCFFLFLSRISGEQRSIV